MNVLVKKIILIALLAHLTVFQSILSAQSFNRGDITFMAGYGFPNLIGSVFNAYESQLGYTSSSLGPFYLKGEYAINKRLGAGINIAWANSQASYLIKDFTPDSILSDFNAKVNRSTYSILVRMNYHFGRSSRVDPYAGFGIGYRNAKWTFSDDDPNLSLSQSIPNLIPLGFELTAGVRYYFTNLIGLYAEAGFSKAPVQGGVILKF